METCHGQWAALSHYFTASIKVRWRCIHFHCWNIGPQHTLVSLRVPRFGRLLPSGLAQMKTRTLRPVGTWCGGRALMLPLTAALRSADSRGQGCLLPTPDGHMGGDFQRGCYTRTQTHRLAWPGGAHPGTWTGVHVCAQIHPNVRGVTAGKRFLIYN